MVGTSKRGAPLCLRIILLSVIVQQLFHISNSDHLHIKRFMVLKGVDYFGNEAIASISI